MYTTGKCENGSYCPHAHEPNEITFVNHKPCNINHSVFHEPQISHQSASCGFSHAHVETAGGLIGVPREMILHYQMEILRQANLRHEAEKQYVAKLTDTEVHFEQAEKQYVAKLTDTEVHFDQAEKQYVAKLTDMEAKLEQAEQIKDVTILTRDILAKDLQQMRDLYSTTAELLATVINSKK
jgi:hypothetical protein